MIFLPLFCSQAGLLSFIFTRLKSNSVLLFHSLTFPLPYSLFHLPLLLSNSNCFFWQVITELATRSMSSALYFCSGTYNQAAFHHYALNVPFYTHFTSPIRRYPDILVHRLVAASVKKQGQQKLFSPPPLFPLVPFFVFIFLLFHFHFPYPFFPFFIFLYFLFIGFIFRFYFFFHFLSCCFLGKNKVQQKIFFFFSFIFFLFSITCFRI